MESKHSFTPLTILLCAALLSAFAQAGQVDLKDAENQYQKFIPNEVSANNLKVLKVQADGTRGYGFSIWKGQPTLSGTHAFKSNNDEFLQQAYCGADLIVRAKNVDSASMLTAGKKMVVTSSNFSVVDTIKGAASLNGSSLAVLRPGGSVTEDGERYNIVNGSLSAYIPGRQYLLLLSKSKAAGGSNLYGQSRNIEIRNDQVFHDDGNWLGVIPGTDYQQFKTQLAQLITAHPCQ